MFLLLNYLGSLFSYGACLIPFVGNICFVCASCQGKPRNTVSLTRGFRLDILAKRNDIQFTNYSTLNMNYLALEVFNRDGNGSKFANLDDNASITITITSPIFDSGDIWTHDFTLSIPANTHIFGSAGELHGSRLHEQVDKRRARLWVMGLPLYYGYIRLGDEVEVDEEGNIDISFESGQKTFQDMIDGGKANQVPLMNDVFIGMALKEERTLNRTKAQMDVIGYSTVRKKNEFEELIQVNFTGQADFAQAFPKHVRPSGTWNKIGENESVVISPDITINKTFPYDSAHPYCNTRICYQKHIFEENNGSLENVAKREYKISEPLRVNPSPNFYVLYWIDCLMKHLGISIYENKMLEVEDLRRLFFVNTKCAYKPLGDYYTGPSLQFNPFGQNFIPIGTSDDPSWKFSAKKIGEQWTSYTWSADLTYVGVGNSNAVKWSKAYATSDNFPNVDINEVVDAIESGFGVRLLFNNDYTKVRIVLLRDLLRSKEVHEVQCGITDNPTKEENGIRGFRLTYGSGEDDTNYFYRGFASKLKDNAGLWTETSNTHDYSQWDITKHYVGIKDEVGMLNKTCYIDSTTGNAYIVKIDENWKDAGDDANPSLFECAPFMDSEDGDCTAGEDTIKEIKVGFSPIIENVVPEGYALFVDAEMGVSSEEIEIGYDTNPLELPRLLKDTIAGDQKIGCNQSKQTRIAQSGLFEIATKTPFNPITVTVYNRDSSAHVDVETTGYIRDGYRIYLQDNYKPGEDLECPLEKVDWGLTFGIMRGSGSDASIKYSDDLEENEGNETWDIIQGSNAYAHSDTCDDNGTEWDYIGEVEGYTGYEYGDMLLSTFGCQDICNLKELKGPLPTSGRIIGVLPSYGYDEHPELNILTDEGYYAVESVITDASGIEHTVWLSCVSRDGVLHRCDNVEDHILYLQEGSDDTPPADANEIIARENSLQDLRLIAVDPKTDISILHSVCNYYLKGDAVVHSYFDDRVSLKLRAEKPNPYFDPSKPESQSNKKYLEITNQALKHRGLADRFYKEYSYWVRNARIAMMSLQMEIATLLGIDMTVRQQIGDITGFIKKMKLTVNNKKGMSNVDTEVWYL